MSVLELRKRPGAAAVLGMCLALGGCGGGEPVAVTPVPSPTPTPIPSPTPSPTPVTRCSPLPVPITRWVVKVQYRGEYWTIDATPFVGPDVGYCRDVGFPNGTSICPVRPEGDPMREECEAYAVGIAADTKRPGPTWTLDGHYCTGKASGCVNSDTNQYQVWAYSGGLYRACAANFACGDLLVER